MTTLVATTSAGDLVQSKYSDSKLDTILAQLRKDIDTANTKIKKLSDALANHKRISVTTDDTILLKLSGTNDCLDGGGDNRYHRWACDASNKNQPHKIQKVVESFNLPTRDGLPELG